VTRWSWVWFPDAAPWANNLRQVVHTRMPPCRLQWFSGSVLVCSVREPRFVSHRLEHGVHTLTAVPRLTQTFTLHGMVIWMSAFELNNNNKWRWSCGWRTHSPSQLSWSHGLCTHQMNRANYCYISGYDDSTINIVRLLLLFLFDSCYLSHIEFTLCLPKKNYLAVLFSA